MTDFEVVKAQQQRMWAAGDFAMIGWNTAYPGELLCEAARLRAGERVLDVACGSGNAALSAARRLCNAVGVDYVPALIERARERATVERLPAQFDVADCEALPFPDGAFDVVMSIYGSMFAPNQEHAAKELLRVCRRGGRIALGNWTPESFWGQTFALNARYLPPPAGLPSPTLWGTHARLRALFADAVGDMEITPRWAQFRFRDSAHWVEVFSRYFGPVMRVLDALDAERRGHYLTELHGILNRFNRSGDSSLLVSAEYLEVVCRKL